MAVAEAAIQARAGVDGLPDRTWRRVLCVVSLCTNNLPDSDLLLSSLTTGKLGYLLQHRGFTHTLALVVPQGLAPLVAVAALARWRRWDWGRRDWLWLAGVAVLGPALHI